MNTTAPLAPGFGQARVIAPGARAAWGARLIVTQDGTTDLVWDRTGWDGPNPACTELQDVLNAGALREARNAVEDLLASGLMDTRKGDAFVLCQDDGLVIVADTNGSAGYCYLTAFLL